MFESDFLCELMGETWNSCALLAPSVRNKRRDLLVHNFIYDFGNLYTNINHHQGYPARAGIMLTLK